MGSWVRQIPGLPTASTAQLGVISIATLPEAQAGTDQSKAITPFTMNEILKKPQATEDVYGTTKYANATERMNESNNVTTITPLGLNDVFNKRQATEAKSGAAKLSTSAQARTGSDDKTIMTPLKVKQSIDANVQPVATASETVTGVSKLATVAEIQAGVSRSGVAISPYGFANARGTSTAYGTFKSANDADMTTLTATDKAITPKALGDNKGSVSKFGIVGLVNDLTPSQPNKALAANANVLSRAGGSMTGDITYDITGKGIRWNFNTDSAWITFHSNGDQDPNTRMEFVVADNMTEYFTWKALDTSGNLHEIMRATPQKQLFVYNGIFDRGHLVYSPANKPSPADIGAMRNAWGALQLTGELNAMDQPVDYALPVGYVQVGLHSWHSNKTEDRVWRIYYRYLG